MAIKYLVSGGNGSWLHPSNWSLTSGGVGGAPQPTAGDDVIFDANSLNAPITVGGSSGCLTVYMSGYTGTMTYSSTLNVGNSFEYSSGMTTAGSGTLLLGFNLSTPATTCVVKFNGVTHNASLTFSNNNGTLCTYNITGDMNIMGTTAFANSNLGGAGTKLSLAGSGRVLMNGSMTIFTNGNRWLGGSGGVTLHFVGSNSGVFQSGVNSYIFLNITFQKTGGTINNTVGALYTRGVGSQTVTYISGNFINFICSNQYNTIYDTDGMIWSTFTASNNFTNNSLLSVQNTLTTSASIIIAGAGDITCNNLTNLNSLGLAAGKTLNINNTWTSVGTAASVFTIYSTTLSAKANIILSNSGNQDVAHTNGRDIDSDGGLTIYSYRAASIVRCDNWSTLPIITSINTNSILR